MQYSDLANVLYSEWEAFTATKMRGMSVAWMNPYHPIGVNTDQESQRIDFLEKFSYAITHTSCLKNIEFDHNDRIELLAERYGGRGIGFNGGGVRCGTLGNYQLKGIGTNCLVGDHTNVVHSYGGLDARSAINEAILTNTLAKVLPIGVAQVYGIIFTGTNTALDPISGETCWGAILVREACIRPAHFLPAPGFLPLPQYRRLLRPDNARTRNVNRALAKYLESPNKFIMLLGSFLGNCAHQLAFARVARIMHSTLSPSNISIDGRWLDVPLSGFISGGENFTLSSAFYNEAVDPLNFCMELLHVFGKLNDKLLNPAPLISYYNEQYDACFSHHLGYLFALPDDALIAQTTSEWAEVKSVVIKVINAGKEINRSWSSPKENDPVVDLVNGLFLSIANEKAAFILFKSTKISYESLQKSILAFRKILDLAANEAGQDLLTFSLPLAISAIKRGVLSGIFYMSEIDREIRTLCNEGMPETIAHTINSYDKTSSWVFEKSNTSILTILQSDYLHYYFDKSDSCYKINNFNLHTEFVKNLGCSFKESLHYFKKNHSFEIKQHGFSFKNYFLKLNTLAIFFEK